MLLSGFLRCLDVDAVLVKQSLPSPLLVAGAVDS